LVDCASAFLIKARSRRIGLSRLALAGWIFLQFCGATAGAQIVTFEEAIPVPSNVESQYCNDLDRNQGVEFRLPVTIVEPTVGTSSATHAAAQIPSSDDVVGFSGGIHITFTTGQTRVAVKVGLNESADIPITAFMRAYDDPDIDEGTKLTPDPGPSVLLGTGPTAITQFLTFATPDRRPSIRRVEILFLDANGQSAQEMIDDLVFSDIGPTCVVDAQPPR